MDILNLKRNRDAWATIRGYIYQVELTLEHWILLEENSLLELERAEDIDVVEMLGDSSERTLTQVKHRNKKLTLRSPEALEAIVNFFEHRQANPEKQLTFRFITNAEVSIERPPLFPHKVSGIQIWGDLHKSELTNTSTQDNLEKIKKFLISSTRPTPVDHDLWELWLQFLQHSSINDFFDFVKKFTWSTQHISIVKIEDHVKNLLLQKEVIKSDHDKESVYERLFVYVFKVLSAPGLKCLTKNDLITQAHRVLQHDEVELLAYIRQVWAEFEERINLLEHALEKQQNHVEVLNEHVELLKEEVGFKASVNLDVIRPALEIPSFEKAVSRTNIVSCIISKFSSVTCIVLHGEIGKGKSQLAALIAQRSGALKGWVRLRDLNPQHASVRIDEALSYLTNSIPSGDWKEWYTIALGTLNINDLLVLDDLPRTNGSSILDEKLSLLIKTCHSFGIKLITTSAFPLPHNFKPFVSNGIILPIDIPMFDDQDLSEFLLLYNAPYEIVNNEKLISLFISLTKGHPVLVTAAVHYLYEKNWHIDNHILEGLFTGDYTSDLNMFIQQELLGKLEDSDTRDFLYRLTLINAPFNMNQVRIISKVTPSIPRAFEKLTNVTGLWVQKDSENIYQVTPLLSALGPMNLELRIIKEIHFFLGKDIIDSYEITPLEGIRALGHFVSAAAFKEAGLILLISLQKIEEHEAWDDVWGITKIWSDSPLPQEMDLKMKLAIRIKQISVYTKMNKPIKKFLNHLDSLLNSTDMSDPFIVTVSLSASVYHALESPEKANSYILNFLTYHRSSNEPIDINPINSLELLWITSAGIRTPEQLMNWLKTVENLTDDELGQFKESKLYAESSIHLCDRIWTQELDKPQHQRNWEGIIGLLDKIKQYSLQFKLEILWACSIRSSIIVLAEYQNQFVTANKLAINSVETSPHDPIVQYLIKGALGRQYLKDKQPYEAITWLSMALKTEIVHFPIHQIYSYIELSESISSLNPTQATFFTARAVEIAHINETVPDTLLVKTLGEHIIALWLANDIQPALTFYEEAVEQLLQADMSLTEWKELFLIFGHVSGYVLSMITTGQPPEGVHNGIYTTPERGFFLVDRPAVASLHQSKNDFLLAAHLSGLFEFFGMHEKSSYWILRSIDIALERNAGPSLGLLGGQALPILIKEKQYALAINLSLEMQTIFALHKLGETYNSDSIKVLGSKPNENWNHIEEAAAEDTIIIITMQLLDIMNKKTIDTQDLIAELLSLCKQLQLNASSPLFWKNIEETIETIFIDNLTFFELANRGNSFKQWNCIKCLYYLGAVIQAPPIDAMKIYKSIFSIINNISIRWEELNKQIIIPFVASNWISILTIYRHHFIDPELMFRNLRDYCESRRTFSVFLEEIESQII